MNVLLNDMLELKDFHEKVQKISNLERNINPDVIVPLASENWGTAEQVWREIIRGRNSFYKDVKWAFKNSGVLQRFDRIDQFCNNIFSCEEEIIKLLKERNSNKIDDIKEKIRTFFEFFNDLSEIIDDYLKLEIKKIGRD